MLAVIMRLMDCRPFKGRAHWEDRIAMEVASMLRAATLERRMIGTWTHVANELGGGNAKTSQIRYALAKAMGLIKGAPDYVFVWDGGGGWIELKAGPAGRTPIQRDFGKWCEATGSRYAVCTTCDEVEDILISWGVLRK